MNVRFYEEDQEFPFNIIQSGICLIETSEYFDFINKGILIQLT